MAMTAACQGLNPYAAEDQTDPCGRTPSSYRSIRGGSWGYYDMSQRCCDREYKNPGYGCYIYIGFRVAI
jgi:formylglycine-generating enzyme required for sulfatase activity